MTILKSQPFAASVFACMIGLHMDSWPQPPLSFFFSFGTPISVLSTAPTLQPTVK